MSPGRHTAMCGDPEARGRDLNPNLGSDPKAKCCTECRELLNEQSLYQAMRQLAHIPLDNLSVEVLAIGSVK